MDNRECQPGSEKPFSVQMPLIASTNVSALNLPIETMDNNLDGLHFRNLNCYQPEFLGPFLATNHFTKNLENLTEEQQELALFLERFPIWTYPEVNYLTLGLSPNTIKKPQTPKSKPFSLMNQEILSYLESDKQVGFFNLKNDINYLIDCEFDFQGMSHILLKKLLSRHVALFTKIEKQKAIALYRKKKKAQRLRCSKRYKVRSFAASKKLRVKGRFIKKGTPLEEKVTIKPPS